MRHVKKGAPDAPPTLRVDYFAPDTGSASAVPLFDVAAPTNTWQLEGGVRFAFPTNTVIGAGGFIVVANIIVDVLYSVVDPRVRLS